MTNVAALEQVRDTVLAAETPSLAGRLDELLEESLVLARLGMP
jgi:hypothetical protein